MHRVKLQKSIWNLSACRLALAYLRLLLVIHRLTGRDRFASMVGMCRSLMADPELIHNAIKGCSEDTRPCLRCMDGCGRIFFGLPVRCAVNPIVGCEYKYPEGKVERARKKKKVVIVGGGPAGMQAAQTAVDRGHDVVLFEKGARLGGLLHDASAVPFKDLMRDYAE